MGAIWSVQEDARWWLCRNVYQQYGEQEKKSSETSLSLFASSFEFCKMMMCPVLVKKRESARGEEKYTYKMTD
eukprot:scaffold22779_cov137-Cylindrotheca_fusiformis.AAC.5